MYASLHISDTWCDRNNEKKVCVKAALLAYIIKYNSITYCSNFTNCG